MMLIAALVSAQGVCAASYQLQMNSDAPECSEFLNIVKASRIAEMTDKELCDATNMPVTQILFSPKFKELGWSQEQMQNVAAVAQSVIEATESVQRRPTFAKSNAEWLEAVMKLNAAGAVNVSHSRVQLTRNAFYVIELTETVCDTSYNKHGPLPLSAFFSDSDHLHPVPNPPLLNGRLVYFDGRLASVYLFPQWIVDPGKHKRRLIVSMQYDIEDAEDGSLKSGVRRSCPIVIEK